MYGLTHNLSGAGASVGVGGDSDVHAVEWNCADHSAGVVVLHLSNTLVGLDSAHTCELVRFNFIPEDVAFVGRASRFDACGRC